MTYLPTLNACLNATSAMFLTLGFYFIRRRNIVAHRACMVSAFCVSVVFLISYLTYHATAGATRFAGQGFVRIVYFTILISHTTLAALVPILAVITLWRAARGRYKKHRQLARWTLPAWLYVSVTGVIVYLMLYHLYPPTYPLGVEVRSLDTSQEANQQSLLESTHRQQAAPGGERRSCCLDEEGVAE